MARSVVLKGTPRCALCQLAPRWCICPEHREHSTPLHLDVLMHPMEYHRPSSTGHLIKRLIPAATLHLHHPSSSFNPAPLLTPGRELWILHPNGEPMPPAPEPSALQVLLIDANWAQSNHLLRAVENHGRRVSLPMYGESRYWLRTQKTSGHFSTFEALLFLLRALRLQDAHDSLRLQFELHVYAGLLSRGQKAEASAYLVDSPIVHVFTEAIRRFAPASPRGRHFRPQE